MAESIASKGLSLFPAKSASSCNGSGCSAEPSACFFVTLSRSEDGMDESREPSCGEAVDRCCCTYGEGGPLTAAEGSPLFACAHQTVAKRGYFPSPTRWTARPSGFAMRRDCDYANRGLLNRCYFRSRSCLRLPPGPGRRWRRQARQQHGRSLSLLLSPVSSTCER